MTKTSHGKRIGSARVALAAGALLAVLPAAVGANTGGAGDPLIEGARQCTQNFPVQEKQNRIPTHLLAAIATTESGRWHEGLGMSVPWPWTINVEGKGYYFDSKAEAIAQVQKLLASGKQSIDVGCMQVNLKHHPRAFADLNQAFDPVTNVAYAAKFLRDNYNGSQDWIKATAAYHSKTPQHGERYLGQIERSWNKIVAKVAAARASKGGEPLAVAKSPVTSPLPKVVNTLQKRPDPASVAASTKPVMAEARRARVISVSDSAERKKSGVMVVRAKPSAPEPVEPVAVASAAPATAPAPAAMPVGDSVRHVDMSRPSAVPQASGPKFVFAN